MTHRLLSYNFKIHYGVTRVVLIPVAVRSKAQACSCLITGIAALNSTESMGVHLLCLLFAVQVSAYVKSLSLIQRSPTRCVCLTVHYLETSTMRQPMPKLGCSATEKKNQSSSFFKIFKEPSVNNFLKGIQKVLSFFFASQCFAICSIGICGSFLSIKTLQI